MSSPSSRRPDRPQAGGQGRGGSGAIRGWVPAAITAVFIWLAWQIVVALLVQRAPVEVAVTVAPGSSQALGRAAEAALLAARPDDARELAGMALRASPSDVRALRVFGLVVAQTDVEAADPILTLVGNWSLRDDPSHAWLIDRRLRQGDYRGAFGHADLLARRRVDTRPQIFTLFTTAAAEDPRSRPALGAILARHPNWRGAYLVHLSQSGERGVQVQAALATGLNSGPGRLTDAELGAVYHQWLREGRVAGILSLRGRLGGLSEAIVNGDFESPGGPPPFDWSVTSRPGLTAVISERDDDPSNSALFVESDSLRGGVGAAQALTLRPGPWRLTGQSRFDAGGEQQTLEWSVTCVESRAVVARWRPTASGDAPTWRRGVVTFDVPRAECALQMLELKSLGSDRRTTVMAWFDDLALSVESVP